MTDLIHFSPGPSQLSEAVLADIHAFTEDGLLSHSHRSARFEELTHEAVMAVRESLEIPPSYRVFFQPSATACMASTLWNVVGQESYHFVHGAFSQRFFQTAVDCGFLAKCHNSAADEGIDWEVAAIPLQTELIALTHCETSTGLMWPWYEIERLRETYPSSLLALDATSSLACMKLNWEILDITFASVQKGIGLPSGLALLVVSPRAYEKALAMEKNGCRAPAWQRFSVLADRIKKHQIMETPNMLGIALLSRQMQRWDLTAVEEATRAKAKLFSRLQPEGWQPFVKNEDWRSITVGNFFVEEPQVWKDKALEAGFVLGAGYGPLRESCVRVANFPAHRYEDLERLLKSF